MKIVQLNVWSGKLGKPIAELLNDEQPDILCLQEVTDYKYDKGGLFMPVAGIQQLMKADFVFFAPVWSFRFSRGLMNFGNCIISKFPISQQETIFTRNQYTEDFDYDEEDYNIRNLQHAFIESGDKSFHVLNHHAHHYQQHKNGDEETLRQMKQVGGYIDKLNGPIILCGDFNLVPQSKSLKQINNRLTNLALKHELKTTRTELSYKTEVCDYIFVNKEVGIKKFYASDKTVSDHKALVLEFDI